jgi:anti-anti-sigma regulatory factor
MSQNQDLAVSFSPNKSIAVVSFAGDLIPSTQASLDAFREDTLKANKLDLVIFDLAKVRNISSEIVPIFAQLQRLIRLAKTELRLSGISPDLKIRLVKLGIIRQSELTTSVKEALDKYALGKSTSLAPNAALKKAA